MPTYQSLVLNTVCRSNHHRIAILALDRLEGEDAQLWRNVFLKYHPEYLAGSKAPDEEFKDFKNHVCHPAEGYWGGAPQAAREWYRRTVRALGAGDFEHAAWNAGVMSHYLADPCQPFHTGQSEAEGVIHRAAEWSFSKAFPELLGIIETHLGWPDLSAPAGDDWIEQMVRTAAERAHAHYDASINHFHLEAAQRRPVDGMDQELKDLIAGQIAYAASLLGCVLDRAIAEAAIEPPKVGLILPSIGVMASAPVHHARRGLEHLRARAEVSAQYDEYRRTGKVRETLGEDDRIVRALHAAEVSMRHLSSIDAEWPREPGLAHGDGAPARERVRLTKAAPKAKDIAAPPNDAPAVETRAPEAPVAAESSPPTPARPRLAREAAIVDAPSIGPKTASRFQVIGVNTVADLLALSPDDAAKRIKASHINARLIRDWQAQALLACSVPDLSGTAAQLLVGAGVASPADLAAADATGLAAKVKAYAATRDGAHLLRGAAPPNEDKVAGWIKSARAA